MKRRAWQTTVVIILAFAALAWLVSPHHHPYAGWPITLGGIVLIGGWWYIGVRWVMPPPEDDSNEGV